MEDLSPKDATKNDVDSVDSATLPSGPGMSFWYLPGVGVVVD